MSDWQPIETAPKDTNDYLVFNAVSEEMFVAYRCGAGSCVWWFSDRHKLQDPPTHWMPLPEPPAPDGAQVETVTLYGRRRLFWTVQNEIDTHRLTLPADMKPRVYTAPDGAQVIVERIDDER